MTAGHRRLSVLLVEDNALDSRLLLEALKPSITAGEVVVQTVKRLEAARLELARYDFSCVLLDLGLPDGVGVDNVRALRAAEPRAAIIVLTGLNDEKTALETMKLGAQDYLVKSEIDAGRLVKLIRQAVERHRQSLVLQTSHDHAVHAATHDELTQLPNAALFLDRARMQMIRSRSRGEPFALLCLEIDGLDLARQRFGALVADELTQRLALRLGERVQAGDTLARIGSQIFALLPQFASDPLSHLQDWAARVAGPVQALTQVGDCPVQLRVHAGFAQMAADDDTADALMESALDDLRRHNDASPGGDMPMPPAATDGSVVASVPAAAMADAAEGEWLPWFDAETGQAAGVDWLPPAGDPQAVPEQAAAILLAQATRLVAQAQQWRTAGCAPPQFGFSVSAAALLQPRFAEALSSCFSRTTLAADTVLLHIGEAVFRRPAEYTECLNALHLAGFRLAMEGDGPTAISLADFSRFPFDAYRLNRDFVRQLLGESLHGSLRRLATAAIAAAQSLGAVVIATGVDHDDSLQALRLIGVRYMQGRRFMAPVGAAGLQTAWASSNEAGA